MSDSVRNRASAFTPTAPVSKPDLPPLTPSGGSSIRDRGASLFATVPTPSASVPRQPVPTPSSTGSVRDRGASLFGAQPPPTLSMPSQQAVPTDAPNRPSSIRDRGASLFGAAPPALAMPSQQVVSTDAANRPSSIRDRGASIFASQLAQTPKASYSAPPTPEGQASVRSRGASLFAGGGIPMIMPGMGPPPRSGAHPVLTPSAAQQSSTGNFPSPTAPASGGDSGQFTHFKRASVSHHRRRPSSLTTNNSFSSEQPIFVVDAALSSPSNKGSTSDGKVETDSIIDELVVEGRPVAELPNLCEETPFALPKAETDDDACNGVTKATVKAVIKAVLKQLDPEGEKFQTEAAITFVVTHFIKKVITAGITAVAEEKTEKPLEETKKKEIVAEAVPQTITDAVSETEIKTETVPEFSLFVEATPVSVGIVELFPDISVQAVTIETTEIETVTETPSVESQHVENTATVPSTNIDAHASPEPTQD